MDPPSDERLDRAVTSPIGIVIILGITLAAAVGILVFGVAALEESQRDSEIGQAELALTQFDSRVSQVALGDSREKAVSMGRGNYRINESAGSVNITHEDWDNDGSNAVILETTDLGAVIYENGDTKMAYQGGAVWRQAPDGDAQMVSPPEFHYRERTLTYPIVTISGEGSRVGETNIHMTGGDTIEVFPHRNEMYDPSTPYENPTGNGSILVTLESEFCTGWESYFESRSEGAIQQSCDEDEDNVVVVDLSIPFAETFEDAVSYQSEFDCNGENCPQAKKSSRPSVSSVIDTEIGNCETGSCEDLNDALVNDNIENETYYSDEPVEFEDETFDATDGDVKIIINSTFEITDDITIDGDGEVQIFVNDDWVMGGGGSINEGGNASQLQIYTHTDVDQITHNGNTHVTGVIYAPDTDFVQNGNGDIIGAVVADTITANGAPAQDWETDDSLDDFTTDLVAGHDPITYLHVTENKVEAELR